MNGVVKLTDGEEKVLDILKKKSNATIKMIYVLAKAVTFDGDRMPSGPIKPATSNGDAFIPLSSP